MDVRLPDGRIIRNVPEGTTKAQLVEKLKANGIELPAETEKPTTGYTAKNARDFLMTSPVGAVARGLKDVVDTGAVGLASIADMVTGGKEADRVRKMNEAGKAEFDAAMSNPAAPPEAAVGAARVSGNVMATAPVVSATGLMAARAVPRLGSAIASSGFSTGAPLAAGAIPKAVDLGIRSAGGAIAGGLSAGMVNPEDLQTGAAIGAAMPGVGAVAGRAGQAVGSALRPNINNPELARKAVKEYGIPLGPADISASRGTKALRSVLNDAPLVGGIGERQAEAVQGGFNRAVGKTFGADAEKLTPDVMDAARKRMGAEFDRIWGRNALKVDVELSQELARLRAEADQLPQGEAARLRKWLADFAGKVNEDEAGNFVMSGETANRLQSALRREADKAQGFLKESLLDLRKGIIGGFNRSVSPEDAAALTTNRGQYKAMKTVEPLMQGAEAGVAGRQVGDVPAGMLPQAVRQSYKNNIAGSPFADLTQIGSQYLADRVARTGGGPRAMIQNSALGSALAFGSFNNPLTLLAVPAAAGAQKALGSPQLTNALMALESNPALANALMNPAVEGGQRLLYLGAPQIGVSR